MNIKISTKIIVVRSTITAFNLSISIALFHFIEQSVFWQFCFRLFQFPKDRFHCLKTQML